jgi:hypothetical protein
MNPKDIRTSSDTDLAGSYDAMLRAPAEQKILLLKPTPASLYRKMVKILNDRR